MTEKHTLTINGRLSFKDAMQKRSAEKKIEKLRAYDHIISHKGFQRILSLEKPTTRKVILEYLRHETTWQTVSLDLNIQASEAQRYFKEGMKRIEKKLGL